MNTIHLKQLLDACFTAKNIVETLPQLPKGMKPRHIHVLDTISQVCQEQKECRVSDVSVRLNITMPSITKLIQELEALEMLKKYGDQEDKRVTLLKLTDTGEAHVKKYVLDFHKEWVKNLDEVSDDQAQEAIKVIKQLQNTMPGR